MANLKWPTWSGQPEMAQPEMALTWSDQNSTWNGPNLKWPNLKWPTWNGQPEMAQPEVGYTHHIYSTYFYNLIDDGIFHNQ